MIKKSIGLLINLLTRVTVVITYRIGVRGCCSWFVILPHPPSEYEFISDLVMTGLFGSTSNSAPRVRPFILRRSNPRTWPSLPSLSNSGDVFWVGDPPWVLGPLEGLLQCSVLNKIAAVFSSCLRLYCKWSVSPLGSDARWSKEMYCSPTPLVFNVYSL